MTKKFVWLAAIALLVTTAIGLTSAETADANAPRPDGIPAHRSMPADVRAVLQRSCADCHSNATRWPWYSKLPPASWLMARHVAAGREKLNFSEWSDGGTLSPNQVQEICDAVEGGEMPPASYTLVHWSAALSTDDKRALCAWPDDLRSAAARRSAKARRRVRSVRGEAR